MRVLITGSHGLIGSAVASVLEAEGNRVLRLVRRSPAPGEARWDPAAGTIDLEALRGIDAAVHLAGESIGAGRWTPDRKERLLSSRVKGARLLAKSIAGMDPPPHALLSASAVGFYGDRGDEVLSEASAPGSGFLPDLCRQWEEACRPAADAGIRVVYMRLGLVLSDAGGALKQMLPPFRLGLGGPLGSGRQFMSWITLDDAVAAILHLLNADTVSGPVNVTSPTPVTNREFTRALGRALGRPAFGRVPAFALRAMFGQMADEALLASQRASPRRLLDCGLEFQHPDIEPALRHVLKRNGAPPRQ